MVGNVIPIVEDDYVVLPAAMQSDPEEAEKDAKAKFATGFLKVTPAHDPNDYEIGIRHKLDQINVLAPDGSISDKHGWSKPEEIAGAHILVGKKREDARKLVVKEFEARGLFERAVPYRHSVKHSDRSKAIIEPYLSDQWYVKVTDERMAGAALRAMVPEQKAAKQQSSTTAKGDGELRFYPERYAKTFELWHENIRDWCISRQLWWGHRIPVWVANTWNIRDAVLDAPTPSAGIDRDLRIRDAVERWEREGRVIARGEGSARPRSEIEQLRGNDPDRFICVLDPEDTEISSFLQEHRFTRDPDVLDTWFSSALWPMSTLGWPENTSLLNAFNPSSTLCTAREIITLWVSRMVMFNRYLMPEGWSGNTKASPPPSPLPRGGGAGPLPFRDVFIHALIMDGQGQKMSKMLGNGVDPLDIIASHGSDAMRFVICQMTTQTQDVRMPVQKDPTTGRNTSNKFDIGRNFCNKLWQVSTGFALAKLTSTSPEQSRPRKDLLLIDRWMLSRLAAATELVNSALKSYEYSEYAQTLYDLMWRDFCDWYIEGIKPTIGTDAMQRAVLHHALEAIVRLLHPVAPYITEAIWERLREVRTLPIEGISLGPSRKGDLLC